MPGEPGIKVEKPVSALQKDIKVNPKGLFGSLSNAIAFTQQNWAMYLAWYWRE